MHSTTLALNHLRQATRGIVEWYRQKAEGEEEPQKPALTPSSDQPKPQPKKPEPEPAKIFGTAQPPKPGELERVVKEMVWGTRRGS